MASGHTLVQKPLFSIRMRHLEAVQIKQDLHASTDVIQTHQSDSCQSSNDPPTSCSQPSLEVIKGKLLTFPLRESLDTNNEGRYVFTGVTFSR